MQKVEDAKRQALEAREKALACADRYEREEWLQVAKMWNDLAEEYRRLLQREAQGAANR